MKNKVQEYMDKASEHVPGPIMVHSVFDFKGNEELFGFLGLCRRMNNIVSFVKEDFVVEPDDDFDPVLNMKLIMYAWLSTSPIELEQYLSYLTEKERYSE